MTEDNTSTRKTTKRQQTINQVSELTKSTPLQPVSSNHVHSIVTPAGQETKEVIKACECHQLKAELASLKLVLQSLQIDTQKTFDAQEEEIEELKTQVTRLHAENSTLKRDLQKRNHDSSAENASLMKELQTEVHHLRFNYAKMTEDLAACKKSIQSMESSNEWVACNDTDEENTDEDIPLNTYENTYIDQQSRLIAEWKKPVKAY